MRISAKAGATLPLTRLWTRSRSFTWVTRRTFFRAVSGPNSFKSSNPVGRSVSFLLAVNVFSAHRNVI